ncbi:MAG: DUF1365 domain-containing protein [Gammaproteobacteria bacterium]|nr:DUF1365 domain-containing protein [Gammaproteobacteria bacterium]
MKSCIYHGQVKHRRRTPVENRFEYSVFMMYADLDEITSVLDRFLLWSARRPSLAWFRRKDHTGSENESLQESVRKLIEDKTGRKSTGPVRLLTNFRYFGYCFNPISIFYCFNEDETLQDIVFEVTNTPWGQTHCYVLPAEENTAQNGFSFDFKKSLHVSPFMSMDMSYKARLTEPASSLFMSMENRHDGRKIFDAQLALKKLPISSRNMAKTLLRDPIVTFRVITLIHWQAIKLWIKRVPVVAHPRKNIP